MFLSVILAYVIAAVFAFCGVMGTVHYVMEAPQDMGYHAFLSGISLALWPMAVAAALLLLTQIACKIERWILFWSMAQVPAAPAAKSTSPKHAEEQESPARASSSRRASRRVTSISPPAMLDTLVPSPAKPTVPVDSPEGFSRDRETPDSSIPMPPQPSAPGKDGLNFFKLD